MVTINIGRKELFFFVGVLVLLVGAGFGVAYGGNQPDVVGHSAGEIERYFPSSVKATTSNHNGIFTTGNDGYFIMKNWIQSNGCEDYHVCDVSEIVNYMQETGADVPEGWVIGGLKDRTRNGAHYLDCSGWTDRFGGGDTGSQGAYWDPSINSLEQDRCNGERPVLCCK